VDQFLTPAEVAARFSVDVRTLRRWRKQGIGPQFYEVGRIVRYSADDVTSWLQQHMVAL
jgi:excisionase family DNA binding protein